MSKFSNNILLQSIFFTFLWQLSLFILYFVDLIHYNPLLELSDILPNFFFIFFVTMLFSSPLFSIILIFILYILGVVLYFFTKQNITIAQLNNLPELISIFYPTSLYIIIFLLISIYLLFRVSIKINFIKQEKKKHILIIAISSSLLLALAFSTQLYFNKIKGYNANNFNKFATWKNGGQLYSILYHYAESKNTKIALSKISGDLTASLDFEDYPQSNLMIIILLESFVPKSDIQPDPLNPFLKDQGFNSIILESPTYGGLSAKSEFEILCGLPELQIFGDMTFNYFGGKNTKFCLPSLFSKYNFKTISITGTDPHFHNVKKAYPSIGFQKMISKKDLNKDDYDGNHPSDKTLYDRAFKEILSNKDQSKFLYIFTAAGHNPYQLNPLNRPKLSNDKYIDRITYSERELKKFISQIEKLNLQSSIVIASDHASESSKLNRNNKLLKVWFKSKSFKKNDIKANCSQYFEIPKFFTGQKCYKIKKSENQIIGRGENLPNYNDFKNMTLKLIRNSYQ